MKTQKYRSIITFEQRKIVQDALLLSKKECKKLLEDNDINMQAFTNELKYYKDRYKDDAYKASLAHGLFMLRAHANLLPKMKNKERFLKERDYVTREHLIYYANRFGELLKPFLEAGIKITIKEKIIKTHKPPKKLVIHQFAHKYHQKLKDGLYNADDNYLVIKNKGFEIWTKNNK